MPDIGTITGTFVLDDVLREAGSRGCGRAHDAAGTPVFMRWKLLRGAEDALVGGPEHEYRVLCEIPMRGTPTPIDLIHCDKSVWCVTEWIDGVQLHKAGEVDPDDIAAAVLEVLDRTHASGWIHGDLKPENLMVGPDGTVTLVDWELAREIGERAAPATIGYSPPWAWAPGYTAKPRSDLYSLAVILWEMLHGRRAFEGSRSSVLLQQKDFRLSELGEDARPCGPLTRSVLEAADAGAGRLAPEVWSRRLLTGVDEQRAVALAARRDAKQVLQEARRVAESPGLVRVKSTILGASHYSSLLRAIRQHVRIEDASNCIDAHVLFAFAGTQDQAAEADATVSAVDFARSRMARCARTSLEIAVRTGPLMVLACPLLMNPQLRAIWHELTRIVEEQQADLGGVSLLELDLGVVPELDLGDGRAYVKRVLEPAFAPTHVTSEVATVLAPYASRGGADLLRAAAALEEERLLERSAGGVSLVQDTDAVRGVLERSFGLGRDGIPESELAAGTPDLTHSMESVLARQDLTAADAVEAALVWGETAALSGRNAIVQRACMRATTAMPSLETIPSAQRIRLGDLWLEVRRADGAIHVLTLRLGEGEQADPQRLTRLARAFVVARSLEDLRETIGQLDQVETTDDAIRTEVARLRAVMYRLSGDLRAAYTELRRSLRARARTESPSVAVLDSLGNILRLLERRHSGLRTLRLAHERAARSGSVRVSIVSSMNLLIARSGELTAEHTGRAWGRLRDQCTAWGFVDEATACAVRAAAAWLADYQPEAALAAVDGVLKTESGSAGRLVWRRRARLVQAIAVDMLGWLDQLPDAVDATAAGEEVLSLAQVARAVAWELGVADDPCLVGATNWRRSGEVRAVRAVWRAVRRERLSTVRLGRLITGHHAVFGPGSPVVGHLARIVAREARSGEVLEQLLSTARDSVAEDPDQADWAMALHAVALAWRPERSAQTVQWVAERANADDRMRPAGVRAWEWRLAIALSDVLAEGGETSAERANHVLSAIEDQLEHVPAHARDPYAKLLPLRNVGVIAGVDDEVQRATSAVRAQCRTLLEFRASLQRCCARRTAAEAAGPTLSRVFEAAIEVQAATSLDDALAAVVRGIVAIFRAERAVILLDAGGRAHAKVAIAGSVSEVAPGEAEISQTVLERVRRDGRVCVIDDATIDSGLQDRPSIRTTRPRSLMVAPLILHGRSVGYLYLENRSLARSFSDADTTTLAGFVAQVSMLIDNARLIEDLRSAVKERSKARTEAERAESLRALGRSAGQVAHDINNILGVILGRTQLLLRDRATAPFRKPLQMIERAARDGADAIQRIQDSTRVHEKGAAHTIGVVRVVKQVLEEVSLDWEAKGLQIEVEFRRSDNVYVHGVPGELREVFTNLLVNASHAMEPDGGRLVVSVSDAGDAVLVEVEDTGDGIPESVLARVFDAFFTTKGDRGNGLGLSLSRQIVEAHGGSLTASSVVGVGTTMRVALPHAAARQRVLRSRTPVTAGPTGS